MMEAMELFASRRAGAECLSDLTLDRIVAGEIPEREHLRACAPCAARLEDLRAEKAEFARSFWIQGTAMKTLARVRSQEAPPSVSRTAWTSRAGAIMAMAAMLLVAVMAGPAFDSGTRAKGSLELSLIARHRADGRVERMLPGDALAAGDAIQFEVRSDRSGMLTIASIDQGGHVSRYSRARVMAGQKRLLPDAIELDATPGAERIFAILCEGSLMSSIDAGAARALEAAHGDPAAVQSLGSGCTETSFLVRKAP